MNDTTTETERLSWIEKVHNWRVKHVSERMFVLILAFFVGLFSAVAAFILHWIINQIVALLTGSFNARSLWARKPLCQP